MPRNCCLPAVWTHLPQEVHMDMAEKESNMPNVSTTSDIANMHIHQSAIELENYETGAFHAETLACSCKLVRQS